MNKKGTPPVRQDFSDRIVRRYICAYFDHLQSEYLRVAPAADEKNRRLGERLEPIFQRRAEGELSWDDVYTFDLELLELLSDEDLVRKAYDMRSKYRSIAGARDYDAYIASKPPDLTTLQLESVKEPADKASVAAEVLRADIRYLLGQFYLHYSMMPLREGLRDELTRRARKWTLTFLGIFSALIIASQLIGQFSPWFAALVNSTVAIGTSTVAVVIFAGIMGGCVSMLQRIQSAPNEGDALYNLAALSHGWNGISLSPLYGAIFALLLYVLFTAGILKGAVFPEVDALKASPPAPAGVSTQAPPGAAAPAPQPPAAAPVAAAATSAQGVSGLPFSDTAPVSGKAYALLVIWSFIAGFAERLVPDTLNRLVTKNESIQGTNG